MILVNVYSLIGRFNWIPTKFSACFRTDLTRITTKSILKFSWECKGSRTSHTPLKIKVGGLALPESKMHYKAIVISQVWNWCKDRQMDQIKQHKGPRNNSVPMWTIGLKQN